MQSFKLKNWLPTGGRSEVVVLCNLLFMVSKIYRLNFTPLTIVFAKTLILLESERLKCHPFGALQHQIPGWLSQLPTGYVSLSISICG